VKHTGLFGSLFERRRAQLDGYDDALFTGQDDLASPLLELLRTPRRLSAASRSSLQPGAAPADESDTGQLSRRG
jgi:hypothetical protein